MLMIFLRINGRILKAMSLSKERSEHDKKETFVFIDNLRFADGNISAFLQKLFIIQLFPY